MTNLRDFVEGEFVAVAPRGTYGVPGVSVSSELRHSTDGTVLRHTGQIGLAQGRVDRELDGAFVQAQVGLGLNLPDLVPGRTLDFGGSVFGGLYTTTSSFGLVFSFTGAARFNPPGNVDLRAGGSGVLRIKIIDYALESPPDPAGGSGLGLQGPGSISRTAALQIGYEGRLDNGRMLAGDELNALDEIAQYHYHSRTSHEVNRTGYSASNPSGDNDPANDNDWRLAPDDWRHSNNRGEESDGRTAPEPMDLSNGSLSAPRDGYSVPSKTGHSTRGVYDEDGPGVTIDKNPDRSRTPQPHEGARDEKGRPHDDPDFVGPRPILLDLDGTGLQLTELSRSTTFVDAGNSGLLHRTAWAGAGDGVLFFDADGDGTTGTVGDATLVARAQGYLSRIHITPGT